VINDEGLEDDVMENDELANLGLGEVEAEEEEVPRVTAKQREQEERMRIMELVKDVCTRMEIALTEDMADVAVGKPGMRKLEMLSEVRTVSSKIYATSNASHAFLTSSSV
jgi:hypothetical protein